MARQVLEAVRSSTRAAVGLLVETSYGKGVGCNQSTRHNMYIYKPASAAQASDCLICAWSGTGHWPRLIMTLSVKARRSGCRWLWRCCVAGPLAGFHYPRAEWVHVRRHRHLRFLERHGVLFEAGFYLMTIEVTFRLPELKSEVWMLHCWQCICMWL